MLRAGIVGFGFMGRMHYKCWKNQQQAQVVAICDTNPNLVEDTRKAVGNIAGAADAVDFESLTVYTDFVQMLRKGKLDTVSITLPTHLHVDFATKALKRGIHVLCEKPMSLDVSGCKRMIAAAEKSGKVLQIGHCVRFWPEYAAAKQIIASGQYGKVLAASLRRLSSAPTWSRDGWLNNTGLSGGMILDLHIHDTDFVQYILGTPKAVQSACAKAPNGAEVHVVTNYFYDDKAIVAEGGWAMMPPFGFEMSFNIMLEKATLVYDCTRTPAFRVCPAEGAVFTPSVESGDGYSRQTDYFVQSITARPAESVLTLTESMESVRIVAAEIKSARTGKIVRL
jgi:1,5-anhydro-D-fructose reductase (1,5-anhydro-D-mannitol-forming)